MIPARSRLPPSVAPLLWAFALLAASRLDGAAAAAPVLLVLRGPLSLVLVAIAVGMALGRAGQAEPRPLPDPGPRRLFAAVAIVFVGLGLWYTSQLRVTGDEPHYLVMARSLWREGDLDLRDNYEREDWRADTPGPIRPHYGAPRKDGRPFPAHSPGLPLLLAVPDAAFGRKGCVVVMALLAAWLVVESRALALRATGQASAATLAALASAGPPVAAYAFHLYTEVPSALALALGLRLLKREARAGEAVAAALAASALPWLHVKMAPVAAALGLVAVVLLRGRARAAFVATALGMAAAYSAYYLHVLGQATPLAIYGGVPADASGSPWAAGVGLLLDRSFGLLPMAPVFLLALAGAPWLLRAHRWREASLWPVVLVGLAVLLPILPWRMWWGGQCPPARFLVPLVPVLGVALALRAAGETKAADGTETAQTVCGLLRWRVALLAVGGGLLLFAVLEPGRLLLFGRASVAPRLWDALAGEASPARYLPSLTRPDGAEWRVAAVWVTAIAALLLLDGLARTRERVDRLFRGLGLPLLLLLAVGLGVDHWARGGWPARGEPSRDLGGIESGREGGEPNGGERNAIPRLVQGKGDVLAGVNDTPERRKVVHFTAELLPAKNPAVLGR
jgi:hypothetical protein